MLFGEGVFFRHWDLSRRSRRRNWNGTGDTFPEPRAAAAALSTALLRAQLPGTPRGSAPPTHTMERSFTFYCSSTDSTQEIKELGLFLHVYDFSHPFATTLAAFPTPSTAPWLTPQGCRCPGGQRYSCYGNATSKFAGLHACNILILSFNCQMNFRVAHRKSLLSRFAE